MKILPKSLLTVVFALLLLMNPKSALSQRIFKSNVCKGIRYDTLLVNLLVEQNSISKFYSEGDSYLQRNLIYLDYGFTKNSAFEIYKSDSVIIPIWSEGYKFFHNNDSCLNLATIATFTDLIEGRSLTHKEKREFKKSIITDSNGVTYLRIRAKIMVINAGKAEWLYPKIYCMEKEDIDSVGHPYCKKEFLSTLILADILELDFRVGEKLWKTNYWQ
jgi:hypothetical protein